MLILVLENFTAVPCKYFNSLVGCENGDECPFIHELVVPNGIPMILKPRPWRSEWWLLRRVLPLLILILLLEV
jgi:hypothetical protein